MTAFVSAGEQSAAMIAAVVEHWPDANEDNSVVVPFELNPISSIFGIPSLYTVIHDGEKLHLLVDIDAGTVSTYQYDDDVRAIQLEHLDRLSEDESYRFNALIHLYKETSS